MKHPTQLWVVFFLAFPLFRLPREGACETWDLSSNRRYSRWIVEHGSEYDRHTFIGNENEVAVNWKIDGDMIHVAVAVEADGWVGFGLSKAGGMLGSDIVLFTAHDNKIVDFHSLTNGAPSEDICQDWTLVKSMVEPDLIMFEAKRALVTGDFQDLEVTDDSDISSPGHRVIAAWGDTSNIRYHFGNRVKGVIRFFAPHDDVVGGEKNGVQNIMSKVRESILFSAVDFVIPSNETTYESFCFTSEDLTDQGIPEESTVHMTGADYVSDRTTEALVHHIVLHGSREVDDFCQNVYAPLYLWSPGAEPFHLPSNVGIPLGQNGFKSFRLEIHYDNRENVANMVDNSGVNVYYTTVLREHTAAYMTMGDPWNMLSGKTVGKGVTKHDFSCPGSCTENYLKKQVTVFAEYLHMHETGQRMVNAQVRNGEIIRRAVIDYFDFSQQAFFNVKQGQFNLKSGDEFKTTCYFNQTNSNRKFGYGSQDEMCQAGLWYYPGTDVKESFPGQFMACGYGLAEIYPLCTGSYMNTSLPNEDGMNRSFGFGSQACVLDVAINDATLRQTNDGRDNKSVSGGQYLNSVSAIVGALTSLVSTLFL